MTQTGVSKALKTLFVRAARKGIESQVLQLNDPVLKKLDTKNISLTYPLKEEQYPSMWVSTQFSKLAWQSMNGGQLHPEGYMFAIGDFEARISFEMLALSNEERDSLFDAIVNMIMFGQLESDADAFYSYILNDNLIDVTPMLSEVDTSPDSVTVGTPWDPGQLAYTKTVTFKCYGEFAQRLDNKQLIPLRDIDVTMFDRRDPDENLFL